MPPRKSPPAVPEPEAPDIDEGYGDIGAFLSGLGGEGDHVIHLLRKDAKGKHQFVAALDADTRPEDIQRDHGGGSFLVMVKDAHSNQIVTNKRFGIEGPPKYAAGVEATPVVASQGQGREGLNPSEMLAASIQMMMAAMTNSQQQNQHLLTTLMQQKTEPAKVDTFADIEKALALAERLSGRGESGAAAWIGALPHLEPLIGKLGEALRQPGPPRPAPAPVTSNPPRLRPPEPPKPETSEPPTATGTDARVMLAVQVVLGVAEDEAADPAATAQTVASILGDDAAAALGEHEDAVDTLCRQFPALEGRREFLAAMQAELKAMYSDDDDEPSEPEAPTVPDGEAGKAKAA